MTLLFIHGHERLKEDILGNYYTDGSYNKKIWGRYLNLSKDVKVIFKKDTLKYEQRYAEDNFQVFDKDKMEFIEIPDLTLSYRSFISILKRKELNKIIETSIINNDILIIRLPSSEGFKAIRYAKKHNKEYLIELVGCPWEAYINHSLKGKILAPFMWYLTKSSIKNAPYVVYVTNKFLQKRYPCNGRSIGCSDVELQPVNEITLENRLNKIKKIDKYKTIVLGTIAAVDVKYKGQEYVIKAISKLTMEGYNFEYHIVGGGSSIYLESVAKKYNVEDNVKFLGSVHHEEIFEYLNNIDIYIQPSITEGLPRALIEAISRGCPAIGTDVGGIPELISSEFIFKTKDVNDLAEKLRKMSTETMIEEATKNFNKAKEFDTELLNKTRLEFYKSFKEGIVNYD